MANLRVTQLEKRHTVYRIPAIVWAVLALLTLLGIPHEADFRALPDKPIFAKVRAEYPWQIARQCCGTALFLTIYVYCRMKVASAENRNNGVPQTDSPQRRLQFGVRDLLVLITAAALCLSLWKLSGEWWQAIMLATFIYQAYILRRVPKRRKIVIAWLVTWAIVALMVRLGFG